MFLPMFLLAMLITVVDQSASGAAQKSAADFITGLALLSRIHVMSCHEISLLWYPVKYITPPQRSAQPSNLLYLTLSCVYICTLTAGHRSAVRWSFIFSYPVQHLNIADFHPPSGMKTMQCPVPACCRSSNLIVELFLSNPSPFPWFCVLYPIHNNR